MAENTDRLVLDRSNPLEEQIRDLLEFISGMKRAQGTLTFSGQPADTETIVIGDGTNTQTFEFDDDSSVTAGNITVTIGATAEDTLDNLVTAITDEAPSIADARDPLLVDATKASSTVINLKATLVGTAANVTVVSTAGNITPTGLTGGVDGGQIDTELNVSSIQIGSVDLNDGAGNPIGSTGGSLDVNITGGGGGGTLVDDGDTVDTTTESSILMGTEGGGGASLPGTARAVNVDATGDLQIDVLTSALPTGAATEATLGGVALETGGNLATVAGDTTSLDAKVPAQGAAVTASSMPVNIASDQTVPVSGTVTANAGTNLNTSALALESGGNLDTVAGAVSGSEMQVDVVAALPAGTNAIGKLAANDGVDIGDVSVNNEPSVNLQDGAGTDLTSTTVASDQALDVNVVQGAEVTRAKKTPVRFSKAVTTPGTEVALFASATECVMFQIRAQRATGQNAGDVFIGPTGVDKDTAQTITLERGDYLEQPAIDGVKYDLNEWYIDADTASDGVSGWYIPA